MVNYNNDTGAQMSWVFACLYFRVSKEVDEVIGMKQDISYDDLGHLGYLSQVACF